MNETNAHGETHKQKKFGSLNELKISNYEENKENTGYHEHK